MQTLYAISRVEFGMGTMSEARWRLIRGLLLGAAMTMGAVALIHVLASSLEHRAMQAVEEDKMPEAIPGDARPSRDGYYSRPSRR